MTQKLHIFRIMLCFVLISISATYNTNAQSFKAHIEDVGGYYRLTFTIASNDANNFTPPSLSNFEVLSGPSTSTFSNYQIINGHASHSETTTFTYILSARKSGKITIGPASIRVNGKSVHSNSVTLNAQANHSASNGPHSPNVRTNNSVQQAGSSVTNNDLFIDVTPSRTTVHEQEAVLLTYRIHARVGVGLSNTSLTQKPDFKGLISQEIPLPGNQIQTYIEHRNGRTYRTGTILQYVVFPQTSGKLTIPSITFDCAVVQQDNTMDLADAFFNGGGTISVQVRRSVAPITLQVEALPQPRPAKFSGAVGKFNIQAQLLNKTIKTNDVATYRITLNGLGNLKLISAPQVKFPSDFDTYDAKTTDNTKATANGLHGQLTFDYTFVPRNVGDYAIPATEFVFFDTESNSYKTIRTQAITLHVEKGERSNADVDKQLALLKSDIRPLHTSPSALLEWGTWPFRLLFAIILIICIATLYAVSKWASIRNGVTYKKRYAAQRAIKQLQDCANKTNNSADTLKYVYDYLINTYNLTTSDLTASHIHEVLTNQGLSEAVINKVNQLIEQCQYAQYAPVNANQGNSLAQQAIDIIGKLEAENKKSHK